MLSEFVESWSTILGRRDVMEGIAEMLAVLEVEGFSGWR